MKTSSCKAKGRKLQQDVAKALLAVGQQFGLVAGDVKSTSMGAFGVDVQLSPAALKALGPLAIECKRVESLNVATTFAQHAEKYPSSIPILFHRRSHQTTQVTLGLADFLTILCGWRLNENLKQEF